MGVVKMASNTSKSSTRKKRHSGIPEATFTFGEGKHRFHITETVLGRGTFGECRLGIDAQGQQCAVKVLCKASLDARDLSRVRTEVAVLRRLRHAPYIVRLISFSETTDLIFIVTELAANGTLQSLVDSKGPLVEDDARRLFWQLLAAVDSCHQNRVVHHDLTPTNVLLTEGWHVRVCDFGLSVSVPSTAATINEFGSTPLFAAPELLARRPHDRSVDLYGVGVILYVLLHGVPPFDANNIDDLYTQVLGPVIPGVPNPGDTNPLTPAGLRIHERVTAIRNSSLAQEPEFASDISPQAVDLLRGLLCKDPNKRLKLWQVSRHPWCSHDPAVNGNELAAAAAATDAAAATVPTPVTAAGANPVGGNDATAAAAVRAMVDASYALSANSVCSLDERGDGDSGILDSKELLELGEQIEQARQLLVGAVDCSMTSSSSSSLGRSLSKPGRILSPEPPFTTGGASAVPPCATSKASARSLRRLRSGSPVTTAGSVKHMRPRRHGSAITRSKAKEDQYRRDLLRTSSSL